MKRERELWRKIISFENLLLASKRAQSGKRYQENVLKFNYGLDKEIHRLSEELSEKTYTPGAYREFYIIEPKKRLISAAPYRDRVVHHALCNVIEPIFDRNFIFDSYACRKGKGTHKAINRFQEFSRKARYVLKCDIVKYFPSIDHEILFETIKRKIACKDTLWLIKLIIDNSNTQEPVLHYFPGNDLFTPIQRKVGIPIGNLTSQFFANIYLNGMDHFIKEELGCKYYARYVDDFIVLGDDKKRLFYVKDAIEKYLEGLRLKLHPKKCRVFPVKEGTLFLGFRIWPDRRRVDPANVKRFKKRVKNLQRDYSLGDVGFEKVNESIISWVAHASYGQTWMLRGRLFEDIVFHKGSADKQPCSARRFLEQQQCEQPANIEPQQQHPGQQEQQHRFPLFEDSSLSRAGIGVFTDAPSVP